MRYLGVIGALTTRLYIQSRDMPLLLCVLDRTYVPDSTSCNQNDNRLQTSQTDMGLLYEHSAVTTISGVGVSVRVRDALRNLLRSIQPSFSTNYMNQHVCIAAACVRESHLSSQTSAS